MISDTERREVAANLRSVANAGCIGFQGGVYCALGMLPENSDGMTWLEYIAHNNRALLNHLADLIDRPTCRKVIPNEMEGHVFCSKCGAEIGEYGVPNYCHNCGAEVIK